LAQIPAGSGERLPLSTTLAFAATQVPIGAMALAISVHLPRYFASTLGLSLAVVGAAFAMVRLIDIPLDPWMGLAMDRTRSRFGRYRLWTWIGVPLLSGSLFVLLHAPVGVGQVYLVGLLLVMYLGYSVLLLTSLAWAGSVVTNYDQRSRLFGAFTALGVAGAVAVLVIPVVSERFGHSDGDGVRAMIWTVMVAIPVCALLMTWLTPDAPARPAGHAHFGIGDYWALITRGNVLRVLGADFCATLGPSWMAAIYLFFFKDSRGFDLTQSNLLLMIYIASGFIGAPFTARLANRISKHRALMVNTTVYSLSLFSLELLPRGDFAAALPTMFICGAMGAGITTMVRALTGDVADEIRLENGREWMGLMYSLTNATTKLAGAGSIFLTFNIVLANVGYDPAPGAVNTPHAIHGLVLAFLLGPIVFLLLGGACFLGYRLPPERHAEIRRQLDARDAVQDAA
jgi:Na+/melibiose symporter-like transporter